MEVDLAVFGSFIVVAGVLGAIGHRVQIAVFGELPKASAVGWRKTFYRTLWVHPLLAGLLIGLFHVLPVPEFMGGSLAASVLWYILAGSQSHTVIRWIDSEVKSRIKT